jgi:hypothetical protein
MADVHQCPRCELRFRNKTELDYHWAEEHAPQPPVEREVLGAPPVVEEEEAGGPPVNRQQ